MKLTEKISTIAIAGLLVLSSSCTNLDEKVYSDLTDNNIKFTDAEISSLTGTVYTNLRDTYWSWNGYFDQCEESGDLIMTPYRIGVGWGAQYILMHKHTYNSTVDHFYETWYFPYLGIGYCNKLLDLKQIRENKETTFEIRAMRALFYSVLFDCYRNVPLITTSKLPDGFLPTQEEPKVTYDFIVSELDSAKLYLPKTASYGRMNYYAACMTLAKMYLNHNAWFYGNTTEGYTDKKWFTKALSEVNEVIGSGNYALAANYKDPFMADGNSCKEIIFAIPADATKAGADYLSNKCLHGGSKATFLLKSAPWDGSCALPQFIATYDPDDKRLNDTWLIGQQYSYKKDGVDITIYQYNDYVKAGASGLTKTAITTPNDGDINYTVSVHSIDNPGAYKLEGARFWKFEIASGTGGTYGDDVAYYRLSDAMFIKAECLLRLGTDKQTAADLVSAVRLRSFPTNPAKATRTVAQLEGGSIYDYGLRETQVDNDGHDVANTTHEGGADIELGGLLDDLAWEFVGEHHRRQDLIRFRLSDGSRNVYNGKSRFCYDASKVLPANDVKKDIYPISQTFLDANINLVQNPGY
jgi:starch-binding outer membrane protein, SusD/RagB family